MNKWSSLSAIVQQCPPPPAVVSFKKIYLTRLSSENLLALLLQYIGLMMSPPSFAPVPLWFASGTALALIYMRGPYILPGIGAGTFIVYYFAKMGVLFATYCTGLLTLQVFLLFYISQRSVGPALLFYQLRPFFKFIFYCTLCTAAISFTLVALYATHFYIKRPLLLGTQWWLANLLGTLILSFGITTFDAYFPEMGTIKFLRWHGVALMLLVVLSLVIVLSGKLFVATVAGLALFLLVLSTSKQYAWCGAVFSLFLLGFIDNLAASFSAPLFKFNSPTDLVYWQVGLLVALIINLAISIKHTKI